MRSFWAKLVTLMLSLWTQTVGDFHAQIEARDGQVTFMALDGNELFCNGKNSPTGTLPPKVQLRIGRSFWSISEPPGRQACDPSSSQKSAGSQESRASPPDEDPIPADHLKSWDEKCRQFYNSMRNFGRPNSPTGQLKNTVAVTLFIFSMVALAHAIRSPIIQEPFPVTPESPIGSTPGFPVTPEQKARLQEAARTSGMSEGEMERTRVEMIHQGMFPEDGLGSANAHARDRERSREATGWYK